MQAATKEMEMGNASNENKATRFKYTNMDNIESCITKGIYASKIDAVNDPFESEGVKYPHLYRICCVTNSPRKMLLWAYYTNHRECCVEFDVSSIDTTLLRKVDYVDSFSSHNDMSLDEVFSSLYRKGKEWKHENEYRAVYYAKENKKSNWNIEGDNVYLKATVKSVTFGLFSDQDLPRYKRALETLINYGIEGKKCRLKNNRYELEEDRQFDLEIELERVTHSIETINENKTILSINSTEKKLLKIISELQNKDSKWVSFEKIAKDPSLVSGTQLLLNKGLVMLQYLEEEGKYSFYYSLTELGTKYI